MSAFTAKTSVRPSAAACGLPHDLLSLIDLAVQLKKRASSARVQAGSADVHMQMHKDVKEAFSRRQDGNAYIAIPIDAYGRLVDVIVADAQLWPHDVWEAIRDVCEAAGIVSRSARGLEMLVDHYAWAVGAKPPSLALVTAERFAEARKRLLSRMGRRDDEAESAFVRLIALKAGLATVRLMNTATEARAAVRLGIEMFVLRAQTAERIQKAAPAKQTARATRDGPALTMPKTTASARRSEIASKAALAKHARMGFADRKRKLIEAWDSGRYTSKDRCAEEECGALGISYSVARKALTNKPNLSASKMKKSSQK